MVRVTTIGCNKVMKKGMLKAWILHQLVLFTRTIRLCMETFPLNAFLAVNKQIVSHFLLGYVLSEDKDLKQTPFG